MREMRQVFVAAFLVSFAAAAGAQVDPVASAVEALQRGDAKSAETSLRSELRAHPQNTDALSVLAVVLDQQKRFGEADEIYRRLIRAAPRSVPALNNYGNHLLASGKLDEARQAFLKVVAIDPAHANANLQLANLALKRQQPDQALRYVNALPAAAQKSDAAAQMRMQALYALNRDAEADPIAAQLSAAAREPQKAYALGVALAAAGKYDKAEEMFSRALESAPDNVDVLYNLGLAAARAGHAERARDIFRSVLRRQPTDARTMFDLAVVEIKLGQREAALQTLGEAARIAPDRPEIYRLIAQTTADMGFFRDSVKAWDQYLKLVPKDDVAERERAFAHSADIEPTPEDLAVVKSFVAKHPADAIGHYELGVMLASNNPDQALPELNRALELKPDFVAARGTRGRLHFSQARFEQALADFEAVLKATPDNAVFLDRMGQAYLALGRPADAMKVLQRAAELNPRNSRIWLRLGRALADSGKQDEAKAAFARVRELGQDKSTDYRPPGLVAFLSLPPDEQLSRYRAGVERAIKDDPRNAEAQVEYLKLLLRDGKTDEAARVGRAVMDLPAKPAVPADAGNALLAAGRNDIAVDLLKKAAAADPAHGPVVPLALALLGTGDTAGALAELDRTPAARRTGDYYLARARILEASGKLDDAAAALDQGLAADPTRLDLYRSATAFLIKSGRARDALSLLDRGVAAAPDNPNIALLRVAALTAVGNSKQAEAALKTVANRWPDWTPVWVANAIFAEWRGDAAEVRRLVDVASTLGATDAKDRVSRAAGAGDQAKALSLIELLFT